MTMGKKFYLLRMVLQYSVVNLPRTDRHTLEPPLHMYNPSHGVIPHSS